MHYLLVKMLEHLEDIKIEYLDSSRKGKNKKEKEKIENSKKKNNKD